VSSGAGVDNDGTHGGDAGAGALCGARFTHWNITVTNGRAGLVQIDDIAPCSATVGISEAAPFGRIDVPDFAGPSNPASSPTVSLPSPRPNSTGPAPPAEPRLPGAPAAHVGTTGSHGVNVLPAGDRRIRSAAPRRGEPPVTPLRIARKA
jgi:hypothetical protein